MLQKFKNFLLYLRYDIFKSFLHIQLTFDRIYSIFKCKSKNFDNMVDMVDIVDINTSEDEKEKIIKLYKKTKKERINGFSDSINLDYFPNIFLN